MFITLKDWGERFMAKTGQELQEILKKASKSAREKAKSAGAPLYYLSNGKRIREDADGKKFTLVVDSEGNLLEIPVE
jgi:hypothetical protein